MQFAPHRWFPKLMAVGSAAYGVTVTLIAFAPALVALWRITRPDAGHGVVSVSADNTLMMHITMTSAQLPTWTGSVNLGTLALWLVGPPLLIWIAWLASGPRHSADTPPGLDNSESDVPALDQPGIDPFGLRDEQHTRTTDLQDR